MNKTMTIVNEHPDKQIELAQAAFEQFCGGIKGLFIELNKERENTKLVYKSIREAKLDRNIPDALWEQMEPELKCVPVYNDDGSIRKKLYTVQSVTDWFNDHEVASNDLMFRGMN
ncbi:hypothetical protein [Weissella viridescens]|uniref:hypothetical protein n=1 Tax=Weissella viridescens TaxID=1629 RepID=UPI003AF255C0